MCVCSLRSPAAFSRRNHNKSFTGPTSDNDGCFAYKLDFTDAYLFINLCIVKTVDIPDHDHTISYEIHEQYSQICWYNIIYTSPYLLNQRETQA